MKLRNIRAAVPIACTPLENKGFGLQDGDSGQDSAAHREPRFRRFSRKGAVKSTRKEL
jgi:hypothetical protein